jgi:hypothetical protein
MLSEGAKEVVEATKAGRKVSLVVFVHADVDHQALKGIKDARIRSEKLDNVYRTAKQPILDTFSNYADLRIVDKLEGTPQLLVSGPAQVWRRFLKERPGFVNNPGVEVLPNDLRWSV